VRSACRTEPEAVFGFLGVFGRAPELKRLDDALRAVDLHPRLVPDAVELTALRLLQETTRTKLPPPEAYAATAELLAYCMLGPAHFAAAGELARLEATEARIEAAVRVGDSPDARLILLALHAGLLQPEVAERFGMEAG
jgi:hypothetical protein